MESKSSSAYHGESITRREMLKVMGAAGAGLALAACTPSTPAPTAAPAPQPTPTVIVKGKSRITYWTWLNSKDTASARAKAQAAILDAFRKANPDIELVEEVIAWQQLKAQLLQAVNAGKAPDVCRQRDVDLQTQVAAGSILPLDEFVAGWKDDVKNDFMYSFKDVSFDGKMYALRQSMRPSNMLFYRTDLYKAAGMERAPKTEKEFTEISRATTKPPVSGFVCAFNKSDGLSSFTEQLLPMLWAAGSDIVDPQTSKPTFHQKAGVDAIKWFQAMVNTYKVVPAGAINFDTEARDTQFLSGVAAAAFSVSAKWGDWSQRDVLKGRLGWAAFPNWANDATKPGSPNLAGGWTFTMPKGANKEAAWKLIEFFQTPEAQHFDVVLGQELPTRKAVLQDPYFKTDEAALLRDVLAWVTANPHEATMLKVRKSEALIDALGTAVQQIIANNADVEATLKEAAAKYESQLT